MKRSTKAGTKRYLVPLAVAALAGAALPVSTGASAQAADEAGYSGYSAKATAAPVKIEIYEPTIPIPATPQLEVEVAYTTVEADSGSSMGRSSWLWPGDPVGEGLKTFVEQLGLPPQLGENGYPVQVNSGQPTGEAQQADEPFPGMVMRTSASDTRTVAQAGFSPDGQVQDGSEGDQDQAGGEGTPGVPGLPSIPGLPALPGLSGGSGGSPLSGVGVALQDFGAAITGSSPTAADDGSDSTDDGGESGAPAAPALPPELAALVDVEGFASSSQSVEKDGRIVTTARSALGNVSLLGGLISLDGVVVTSSSASDGTTGKPSGKATLGGLTVAGQEFSFGPDGLVAAGRTTPIPGLPDQAAQALKQLGVKFELPQPVRTKDGAKAVSTMSGLRIDIDSSRLRKQLDALPLDKIIAAIPSQAGQLKTLLQTATGLSPRVVLTLGNAATSVDTVQGIKIPTDVPDNDPGSSGSTGSGGGGGSAGTGGGAASTSGEAAPTSAGGDSPSAAAPDDLGDAQLAGSGLPPLYSIPGAILAGGIALGAVAGTWLRRLGVLTLGGAGSCSHGLDSGLPDLRKA